MHRCSCHDEPVYASEVTFEHELIQIRGAYRYVDRTALDAAVSEIRAELEREQLEPLSLWCWISGPATLSIDITVAMLSDQDLAPALCETLARTAVDAEYEVRARVP